MMFDRLWVVAVAAVLTAVAPSALAAEYKVGFVDVSRVLETAPQAEAARTRIEKEFAPKDRKLVKERKDLRKLEDKLIREGDVMSAEKRGKLQQDILVAKRELRRTQENFREDLNIRRNQELGKLQRRVIVAIQKLAKAEKYDLIVSNGVLFASKAVDITEKVLGLLKGEKGASKKSARKKKK